MKISVLINNYNYADYLVECLESVFAQSQKPYEIIVVDDGSTDESRNILESYGSRIHFISQPNQGQAAAMAVATQEATGDILCYLDSDDVWAPIHLETIDRAFSQNKEVDHVFTVLEQFGNQTGRHPGNQFPTDTLIPCSQQLVLSRRIFLGSPTSANAIRAHYAKKLFNIISEKHIYDHRQNGDEIIVYGTSVLGCAKLALSSITVRYRVHGKNNYCGQDFSPEDLYEQKMRKHRLIQYIAKHESIESDLSELKNEFIRNALHIPRELNIMKGYLNAPRRLGYPISTQITYRLSLWLRTLKLNHIT